MYVVDAAMWKIYQNFPLSCHFTMTEGLSNHLLTSLKKKAKNGRIPPCLQVWCD